MRHTARYCGSMSGLFKQEILSLRYGETGEPHAEVNDPLSA